MPCSLTHKLVAALPGCRDGSCGIYDTAKRQLVWANDRGHTETIFDCSCSPTAPYLCATASYDKVVKLWDMGSGECRCALCSPGQAMPSCCMLATQPSCTQEAAQTKAA